MSGASWLAVGENASEWASLVERVELSDFFQLFAVQLADASLEEAFQASLADATGARWSRFEHSQINDLLTPIPLDAAFRQRLGAAAGWCVVAAGAERGEVARAAAILNQRRDVVRELLTGPLVMVLHPLDWQVLRLEAADLWSVYSGVSRFTAAPLPDAPRFPLERPVTGLELSRVRGVHSFTATAREARRAPDGHSKVGVGDELIKDVVEAVLRNQLLAPSLRWLLLADLPLDVVASLPLQDSPFAQVQSDITRLYVLSRTSNQDPDPWQTWLANASHLAAGDHSAVEVFGRAMRRSPRDGTARSMGARSESFLELSPHIRRIATFMPQSDRHASSALQAIAELVEAADDRGVGACAAVDHAVVVAAAARAPSVIREALYQAASLVESLGDLRLIARLHARAAWIQGHLGDRRSGLAEVEEGRRVATVLGLDGGDDLVTELDTVAHWLERGG